MSDTQKNENEKGMRRYIGKMRGIISKYGTMYKIYMDNLDAIKKDGTPNTYYKGSLVWADALTGKNYHVKQMSLWVPKDGMEPAHIEKGYSHFITLNLDDQYEVTVLG